MSIFDTPKWWPFDAATTNVGAAVWTGVWTFAFAAGVAAVAVSFAAGYRDTSECSAGRRTSTTAVAASLARPTKE